MTDARTVTLSKVPEVTLGFWIIKILATTLGEMGGDAVTMSMLHADKNAHNGGYLIGTGIFLAVFVAAVIARFLRLLPRHRLHGGILDSARLCPGLPSALVLHA